MALAAERKLDDAVNQVRRRKLAIDVAQGAVVDAQPAALDLAPRLAVGFDEPRLHKGRQHAEPGGEFGASDLDGWQALAGRALLKRFLGSFCRGFGGRAAMQQGGCLGGKHLLGLVDLAHP